MLYSTHWLAILFYLTAPVFAAIFAVARSQRKQGQSIITFLTALFAGAMLGTAITVLHAREQHSRATLGQFMLAIYFATGIMIGLRLFNWVIRRMMRQGDSPTVGWRPALFTLLRVTVVIVIGIPYIISGLMIYEPRVLPQSDPMTQLRLRYETVRFDATDGIELSGWWIPATRARRGGRGGGEPSAADFGTKTVIFCHGWGKNKSTQLPMIRRLIPAGYNALIFDFRGHGESEGQFTTLGDLERRDVLGAVRWLNQTHAEQSKRIVGLGVSTGAAALIAAAADPSREGQAIQSIAIYSGFDDLSSLARTLSAASFSPPVDWLTAKLGLSLASLQAGTDLSAFKPAQLVQKLWPRPILVIHATRDQRVPFEHGDRLFDAASFPKQPLWLPHEDHDDSMNDDSAAEAVREFFESARPTPVI